MPKSKRDLLKRRLGYVLGCLETAQEHALDLLCTFAEAAQVDLASEGWQDALATASDTSTHAKLALLLDAGMKQCEYAAATFRAFAMHAWGHLPDKLSRWTNTGQDYRDERNIDD